jgi:hypothetical protein
MGGMSRALFLLLIGGFAATASAAPLPGAGEPMPAYPDPLGVAAPVAGVSGGALLVGGGANFPHGFPWEGGKKVWHDTVYALAPGATNWTPAGRLPRTLAYAVTLTTPEGILVAGGSDADRHYADCFLLRWDGAQLVTEPLPALPLPVANACGALIGRVVFVAGGEAAPGATAGGDQHVGPAPGRAGGGLDAHPGLAGPGAHAGGGRRAAATARSGGRRGAQRGSCGQTRAALSERCLRLRSDARDLAPAGRPPEPRRRRAVPADPPSRTRACSCSAAMTDRNTASSPCRSIPVSRRESSPMTRAPMSGRRPARCRSAALPCRRWSGAG